MSEKQGVKGDIFAQRVKLAYRTTTGEILHSYMCKQGPGYMYYRQDGADC